VSGIEWYERAVGARDAGRWDEAADLFERAFEAGHAVAGLDLAFGLNSRRDHAAAEAWCRRAADAGVAAAAFEVGYIEKRRGDLDAAERWYRRAADGGDASGTLGLGAILEERGNIAEAMDTYRRAWDLGAHEAAFNLGRIIEDEGRGDADRAAEWFERAARRGNGAAWYNLGFIRGDQGDPEARIRCWRRAADLGYPDAAGALAHAFQQRGDRGRARFWRFLPTGLGAYSREFEEFASGVAVAAICRQWVLDKETGDGYVEYDLDARTLTTGGRVLHGLTALGSFSRLDKSWLWTWANDAFRADHPAVAPLRRLRDYGVEHDIPELTIGRLDLSGFPQPEQAATTMVLMAASILGGNGVKACAVGGGDGMGYYHLDDPSLPADDVDPVTAPEAIKAAVAVFARDQRKLVTDFIARYGTAVDLGTDAIVGTFRGGHRLLVRFTPDGRRIQAISYDRGSGDAGS
jgi:TPR repeat protein